MIPLVSSSLRSEPQLITLMSSAVSNLDIFGDGVNRYLYAANTHGRMCGYLIDHVRTSFTASKKPSLGVESRQKEAPTIATAPTDQ